MAQNFDLAPGGAELWDVGGANYLVYTVPTSKPPVYMAWRVRDEEAMKAHIPSGETPKPDRTVSQQEFKNAGVLEFGFSDELRNFNDHPFSEFEQAYEQEAAVQPWLRDPEVLAIVTGAMLEGRAPTTAELSDTDYFKNRSAAEIDWIVGLATDPQAARDKRADARRAVAEQLRKAGVSNAPETLVNILADRWVEGRWSESFVSSQIIGVADPSSGVELQGDVLNAARGFNPHSEDARIKEAGKDAVKERVRRIFQNRGVEIAFGDETEEGRLERIAEEVMNGRSLDDVRFSVNRLAGMPHIQTERDTTRAGEDEVRALAVRWLGPEVGKWSDAKVKEWAGKMRNDPDAETELVEMLRKQRLTVLPRYENENLTYEDIIDPVRNLATNIWGQHVDDEMMLVDLANMGDYTEMGKRLRKEGLNRGVAKTTQDAISGLMSTSMGERVQRSSI